MVGCASKYYICMRGTSTTLSYPSGTFYSASAEKCDFKAHVVKCAVDFTCPIGQAFNLKTVKCAPKIEIQTCPEYEIPQQQPPAPQPHYEQPQTYAPVPPQPPLAQQPPQTYVSAPQQQYIQQAPPPPQQPSYA
uniref:Chitin-binding type-2 domain-containing protein n=1 Tax=Panagrolaimus davidi TaxID=227884 RepID=A0A914PE99_9BILA